MGYGGNAIGARIIAQGQGVVAGSDRVPPDRGGVWAGRDRSRAEGDRAGPSRGADRIGESGYVGFDLANPRVQLRELGVNIGAAEEKIARDIDIAIAPDGEFETAGPVA